MPFVSYRHVDESFLTNPTPTMSIQNLSDEEKAEKMVNKINNHFPNFLDVELTDRGTIRVQDTDHSYINISDPHDKNWIGVRSRLKPKHRKISVEQEMETIYEYLTIAVYEEDKGTVVNAWIESTGTGLGSVGFLHYALTHQELADLNYKAKKVTEGDYFYCSGHEEVEPQENYEYFYFAGKYCTQYKEENPDHYRKAMNESYN